MTSFRLLPPIARPPHDPLWLTLNARLGWRAATLDHAEVADGTSALQLEPIVGVRSLTEDNGSLGGLVPPASVAVTDDDSVFLLDGEHARLRKYDHCICEFITVPGIGGVGSGPRQFRNAKAIAAVGGNILVADSENAKVSIFSQREFVLRGTLDVPEAAGLANTWNPVSIAGDRWGRIFVVDPNNGCVHRFSRRGVWQAHFSGLGAVRHIAVDRDGRLYVLVDGASDVAVLNGNGVLLERVSNVARITERFRSLPFDVAANGMLVFGDSCGAFDLTGNAVAVPEPVSIKYADSGTYLSEAFDSRIHRCQWHRVKLTGEIPPATSVLIRTYSSEVELPNDVVAELPDDAWDVHPVARAVDGDWDCLIRSGGGRYLWLRLDLFGGGPATPRLDEIRVEFPRISLRRFLPAVFGEDPTAADFTDRFLSVFDTAFRDVESQIDNQAKLFDARSTPAGIERGDSDFLSWIASWIGLTVDKRWSEKRRREFVRLAPKLFDARGTRDGLWQMLLLYLGLDNPLTGSRSAGVMFGRGSGCGCGSSNVKRNSLSVPNLAPKCGGRPLNCGPSVSPRPWEPPPLILEHFKLRRWLIVGSGRLGDQAVLWGRKVINPSGELVETEYASRFSIFVPACIGKSAQHRKSLEMLLRSESPAHTRYNIEYVEPTFRIGMQSMIGFDAVVGRYPTKGVTVGSSALGGDSVLSEGRDGANSQGRQVPSMRIGNQSRIGATTRLD